jgi:tetratricopeptide (TPR) repeat protein
MASDEGFIMQVLQQALESHRAGHYADAEAGYDAVLAQQPAQPDALHLKGVLAMQRGDARSAVSLISKAIVARPEQGAYYTNLAAALQTLGLDERAYEYAQRAVGLTSEDSQAWAVLASVSRSRGLVAEAATAYFESFRLTPENKITLEAALDCLRELGRHDQILSAIDQLPGSLEDGLHIRRSQALRGLGRFDEALDAMNACLVRDGHNWHVNMLKLYLERGEPQKGLSHGQALLNIKDVIASERFERSEAGREATDWMGPVQPFRPNDQFAPERNVVCFSLWGDNPKYTLHAVLNAKRVPQLYPGWRARFYVDASVPAEIVQALRDYGARVIEVEADARTHLKLFWRFLASDDLGVERFLCRDCDAVVNEREAAAVSEWIESGRRFHVMRDHPEHAELIMAGMWGGVAGLLPSLTQQAVEYYETHEPKWRWVDQDFLRDCVWPLIRKDCLVHDSVYSMGDDCRAFPAHVPIPLGDHVGGYRPRFSMSSQHGASSH